MKISGYFQKIFRYRIKLITFSNGRYRYQRVHRLYQFIVGENSDAARRAAKSIRQSIKILSTYPDAGRHPDEMESDYRELIIGFGDSGCGSPVPGSPVPE